MTSSFDSFAEGLRQLIREEVARQLAEAKRAEELLDQHNSPIGNRQHINLARTLIARGDSRAAKSGRKFLIERGAILDALGNHTQEREESNDVQSSLAQELGLELHG